MGMDYAYLCTNLGHLMGLQVRIYRDEKLIHSYSNVEFVPDPVELIRSELTSSLYNANYFDTPQFLLFGSVRIKRTTIVIGPTFCIKPGKDQIYAIMRELGISYERLQEFRFYLDNIPTYPIESFLHIISFINYVLNNEKLTTADLLSQGTSPILLESVKKQQVYENTDEVKIHNTFNFEKQILSYITSGKTESLKRLFLEPPTGRVGKIAHDELRQRKNTFICSATLASRAAIAGGLSHEVAFALSDQYIQKVELLLDLQKITKLNVEMFMDFTHRVEELMFHGSKSKYVIDTVRYINRNINERIKIEDISSSMGISRTYLCEIFKSEMDMTVNEFIVQQKIEEAKRLLRVSDQPISNISECLDFSSQSYFQNVFKKFTGKTPSQYRSDNLN